MEENKEEIGGGTLDSKPSELDAALKKEKTITLEDFKDTVPEWAVIRAVEDSHKSEQIKSDKENAERKDSQSAE